MHFYVLEHSQVCLLVTPLLHLSSKACCTTGLPSSLVQSHKLCRLNWAITFSCRFLQVFFSSYSIFTYFHHHKIAPFKYVFAYEKMEKAKRKGHRRKKKRRCSPPHLLPCTLNPMKWMFSSRICCSSQCPSSLRQD